MSGNAHIAQTTFLNVDLEVRGANDLLPLIAALASDKILLHHKPSYFASFEVSQTLKTPEDCIAAFVDLVE